MRPLISRFGLGWTSAIMVTTEKSVLGVTGPLKRARFNIRKALIVLDGFTILSYSLSTSVHGMLMTPLFGASCSH